METTNKYEFFLFKGDGDVWTLEPREYFLNKFGEWDEDEFQIRDNLSYTLSEEEAAFMDLPNSIDGDESTMTDTDDLKYLRKCPQSILDYLDSLPEYTVEPRSFNPWGE